MKTIKEYYNDKGNLNEIFNSIDSPNWRVWTVIDLSGCIRTNKKRINSTNRLREFIGNQPNKIYASIAQFLQPQRVYGKKLKKSQWVIDDSLFIKSDLLFDFDSKDLNIAHEDAKKVIKFMEKQKDYDLLNIRFSGKKGFHLLYRDNKPVIERNPIKRYELTQERREQLINKLPKLETINEHHKKIIADQFRVHSVIGSVKAEAGFKVGKIDLRDFMILSTERLTENVRRRVVRAEKPDDRKDLHSNKPGEERPTLSSSSYNFVDSIVKGTNNMHVTVLKYPIKKDTINIIKNVQKVYNLDSFYKFVYKDIQMWLNFKLVDKRRLEKIMKFSKPMNLNSFMFYGHSWIPIEDVCLKEIIGSGYGVNDTHSRPHANLLNLKFNKMAGSEMNRICKATVQGG